MEQNEEGSHLGSKNRSYHSNYLGGGGVGVAFFKNTLPHKKLPASQKQTQKSVGGAQTALPCKFVYL